MLKSYLLTALRHFSRNKLHASINILGLGLGIMVSLLALIFLLDEKSFDQFHLKGDRIYRLNKVRVDDTGKYVLNAESSGLYGPGMKEAFPEVENFSRYMPWFDEVVLSYEDTNVALKEQRSVFVDNSFFEMFDFEIIQGNKSNVLSRPSTIVLTPALANTLFKNEDPIGKKVVGINSVEFEVTGIVKEAPRHSHIQYDALMSYSTTTPQLGPLDYEWMNNWNTQGITTYLQLHPGANLLDVREKLKPFTSLHIPSRANDYLFYLQPFRELYLQANEVMFHKMAKTGNQRYIIFFELIALFILAIACINYINISTSKASKRGREVGMRKSLGAHKIQLVKQFLGESLVTTVCAACLAAVLLYFTIPWFNSLAGKELNYALLLRYEVLLAFVVLILLVSTIAGAYPAFILSSFKPAEVLKASVKSKLTGSWPRQVLITFQLLMAIIMIAGTLIVSKQLRYVVTKDLGFDKEQVMVMTLTDEMRDKGEVIQQEIEKHSSIVTTSLSRMALGGGSYSTFVQPEGFPPDKVETRMFAVDFNFKNTYGLEMVMGRFFDPKLASDSSALIINETLMQDLRWSDPTNKTIKLDEDGEAFPIVGVVKDFNFRSLYQKVEPVVMFVSARNRRNLSIRFTGSPSELVSFLEKTWSRFESRYPFQYYFVDEAFARSYEADEKLFKTVITFSMLSIFIACLGLYGLVSFTIAQRTKEFGIRKILGATVSGLNFMVNRKFILMVVIAGVMAIPIVLYAVNPWMDGFAYQTEFGPGEFSLAILITMMVTLLAVSIQAIKAANMNPAEALRYE